MFKDVVYVDSPTEPTASVTLNEPADEEGTPPVVTIAFL
jgi:hypothetical protein